MCYIKTKIIQNLCQASTRLPGICPKSFCTYYFSFDPNKIIVWFKPFSLFDNYNRTTTLSQKIKVQVFFINTLYYYPPPPPHMTTLPLFLETTSFFRPKYFQTQKMFRTRILSDLKNTWARPEIFWTKDLFGTHKFWDPKIFWPKFCLGLTFYNPKFVLDPTFFWDPQIFRPTNFWDPKFVQKQNMLGTKYFWDKLFFQTQQFIGPKVFSEFFWLNFLLNQQISDQHFLNQKYFVTQIFLGPSILLDKKSFWDPDWDTFWP